MKLINKLLIILIALSSPSAVWAATTPTTVATVSPILQELDNVVASGNYRQLALFIKNNFPNSVTLNDIEQSANTKANGALQNAVKATKNAKLIKVNFSQKMFLLCAWYIEKQLPIDTLNKSYFPKNDLLPADIEFMSKTKNVYIQLPDRVGRGHKKKVYKSIMYKLLDSEVVARCMQKGAITGEAKMHIALGSKPGIMKVFDYSVRKVNGLTTTTLMAKLYNKGDLENIHNKNCSLSSQERLQICLDVITGLESIHKAGYVDRDLKPLNILVNITKHLNGTDARAVEGVITDFGRAIATRKANHVEAQWPKPNRAPEAVIYQSLKGKSYEKIDIYALGSILYAFVLNRELAPWANENLVRNHNVSDNQKYRDLFSTVSKGTEKARDRVINGMSPSQLSARQKALLLFIQMADANPNNRPTATQAKTRLQAILNNP